MHLGAEIFGVSRHLSVGQECARAAVIFVFGFVLVRLAGRRVFGKWAALDVVVSIIVGSNLSRALTGTAPFAGTLAASLVLVMLHWLLAHLAARSSLVSRILEGRAIELARDGAHDAAVRKRRAVSSADLDEALRRQGLERLDQAHRVVLEPSGKINVVKAEAARPG